MKISDIHQKGLLQNVSQPLSANPAEKNQNLNETEAQTISGDRVEFSARSREMQKIYEVLQKTPDVRSEKVAELKRLIEEGRYHVKSEDLAEKIIKESLLDLIK